MNNGTAPIIVLVLNGRGATAIDAPHGAMRRAGREETVTKAVEVIRRAGCAVAKVLLNTDNEFALVDIGRGVVEAPGTQAVPEAPPAYAPQSHGSVDSAVNGQGYGPRRVCWHPRSGSSGGGASRPVHDVVAR